MSENSVACCRDLIIIMIFFSTYDYWLVHLIKFVPPLQVRQLLDGGMDGNLPAWGSKAQGATPLHLAAQGGRCQVMEELLQRGADIDARTKGACGCKCMKNDTFVLCLNHASIFESFLWYFLLCIFSVIVSVDACIIIESLKELVADL